MNLIYNTDTFRSMFDALPFPVFVVDGDVMVHDYNAGGAQFLLRHTTDLGGLSYPVQNDLTNAGITAVCWRDLFCRDAFIGRAVKEAFQGSLVVRRYEKLDAYREGFRTELETRIKCSPFQNGACTQVLLMIEEVHPAGAIKGVIHICSVCHQVIDEKKILTQLEAYAQEYTGVEFSHGLCRKCYQEEMAKVDAYGYGTPTIHPLKNDGCGWNDLPGRCR